MLRCASSLETFENTGTLALAFAPYDPMNSTGGYGWSFSGVGFMIGEATTVLGLRG